MSNINTSDDLPTLDFNNCLDQDIIKLQHNILPCGEIQTSLAVKTTDEEIKTLVNTCDPVITDSETLKIINPSNPPQTEKDKLETKKDETIQKYIIPKSKAPTEMIKSTVTDFLDKHNIAKLKIDSKSSKHLEVLRIYSELKRFLKGVAKYIGDVEVTSKNIEYRIGTLTSLPPGPYIAYINYSNFGNKFFKSSKDEKEFDVQQISNEEERKRKNEDEKNGVIVKEKEITSMAGLLKKKEADKKKKKEDEKKKVREGIELIEDIDICFVSSVKAGKVFIKNREGKMQILLLVEFISRVRTILFFGLRRTEHDKPKMP